jgi:hypothetical protein
VALLAREVSRVSTETGLRGPGRQKSVREAERFTGLEEMYRVKRQPQASPSPGLLAATRASRLVPATPAAGASGAQRSGTEASTTLRTSTPGSTTPSRAAVIAVTSRGGASPQGVATPSEASGLTAVPAHNRIRSAGQGAALPSDLPALFAVTAPNRVTATGTATTVGPAPAVTPRAPESISGEASSPSNHHRSSTTPQAGWVQSATNRKD